MLTFRDKEKIEKIKQRDVVHILSLKNEKTLVERFRFASRVTFLKEFSSTTKSKLKFNMAVSDDFNGQMMRNVNEKELNCSRQICR